MKIKRSLLLVTTLVMLSAISYGGSSALAEDDSNYPPFVQSFADKFGLNEDEVAETIDEIRADHFAQMAEHHRDRLIEAVSSGALTQEQADAISDKWDEMHTERLSEREENREEMQLFLAQLGIDRDTMHEVMGFGEFKGHHGMHGMMH